MFEIAWSVLTYLVILGLENTSLVAERFGLKRLLRFLRKVVIPIVILGIIISTMHQSSLGALFLLVPQRLSPLWYTPFLPVLFYITAIAAGFSMVIVESCLSASADGRKPETKILSELGKWLPWILGLYLALKVILFVVEGKISYLFAGNVETVLFWVEIIVGVVLPIIILAQKQLRENPIWLFRAALLVVIGIVLNRFNVMFSGQGSILYAPTWIELAVTAGLISLGVLLYMFGVKYFPVLDQEPH
jgi:Ni/Fe-hydrogenase subunit HybB-like protein